MNKTTEEIFAENYCSAQLTATRLKLSVQKLKNLFPLSVNQVGNLDEGNQEALDAFIKRFEQLQNMIDNRLFRGVALLEQEDLTDKSKRDITNLMEKFSIVESADLWSTLSILRNKLAHEYPIYKEKQVDRINTAYKAANTLIDTLSQLKNYVLNKKLLSVNISKTLS